MHKGANCYTESAERLLSCENSPKLLMKAGHMLIILDLRSVRDCGKLGIALLCVRRAGFQILTAVDCAFAMC